MDLKVQINPEFVQANSNIVLPGGGVVMMTPPLSPSYWLMCVPLSEKQAVVCFPKFTTIGIGFQVEQRDWNTNLPASVDAAQIFDHIKINKVVAGDVEISDADCIAAIELLQGAIKELMEKN
jgi:hypothetical protein